VIGKIITSLAWGLGAVVVVLATLCVGIAVAYALILSFNYLGTTLPWPFGGFAICAIGIFVVAFLFKLGQLQQ
jgi:hypothetical protein